jgi:hypothetical protein
MEALFDGRVIPWERRNTHTPERKELEAKIQNEKRYFIEKMSLDDCQRFEALEGLYNDSAFDEEVDIYSHGFTLGALLMLEIMEKKAGIINE